ncbi:MAG: hypothetical protein MJH10_06995 [Epibacterium sp.]|nr:hypothetical protein [Epibacterium sp.]NQX73290.1 hypothetical protein [Epibacterium sp.]
MAVPKHASRRERIWHHTYLVICALIFLFLMAPILVVIPLSFNAEPYFTFTEKMLLLNPQGFSTLLAIVLGTIAALGLSRPEMPGRRVIMAILISPMIVPIIIVATGLFFFYSAISIQNWGIPYLGVILSMATILVLIFIALLTTVELLRRRSEKLRGLIPG